MSAAVTYRPAPSKSDRPSRARVMSQVVAVIALGAYFALLLHKGFIDMAALIAAYPGSEFWPALGRHVVRILGGG
jgi:hypothetical protein